MLRHPIQASFSACGSRLVAMSRESSCRSRHSLPASSHTFPFPYLDSIDVTSRVSSSLALGSGGAASVSDSRSSSSFRASSLGKSAVSKPADSLASLAVASMARLLAKAARAWVSPVM